MTPDACPFCGAPVEGRGRERIYWVCGTNSAKQSPECARYVRTRISQLRRMADCAEYAAWAMENACEEDRDWAAKHRPRMLRFHASCSREIARIQEAQRGAR